MQEKLASGQPHLVTVANDWIARALDAALQELEGLRRQLDDLRVAASAN